MHWYFTTKLDDVKIHKLLNVEIQHPKLRKILSRAVDIWSKPGVMISNIEFGCSSNNGEISYNDKSSGCNLIGASSIGLKPWKNNTVQLFCYNELWTISKITINEYNEINEGFYYRIYDPETPLQKGVQLIRAIVFGYAIK